MSSTRTQVYFTEEQRRHLDAVAERTGKTLAQIVREAVDAYLGTRPNGHAVNEALDRAFGTHPDIEPPDRSQWDERQRRGTA